MNWKLYRTRGEDQEKNKETDAEEYIVEFISPSDLSPALAVSLLLSPEWDTEAGTQRSLC